MKRWAWYFFLITATATGYANAVIALEMGESHHRALAFVLSLFALGGLVLRVAREVRVPYFLPKIRWWESNPRYRLSVPVALSRQSGESLQGEVLDLSASGCFIKLRTDLLQDELVTLAFTIFGQPVQISGTIVWRTASAVTHPKGVGLKFGPIPRPQKRVFRGIKRRLREITRLYRTGRYLMAEDEYSRRLKELQTRPLQ
jgi:hypothetical protein